MPDESRRNRTRKRCLAVAGAALGLLAPLACGGADTSDADTGNGSGTAPADTQAGNGSVAEPRTHEGGGQHTHGPGTHTHAPVDTLVAGAELDGGSGDTWSGSATLLAVGDSVRVLVSLEGAPSGARYSAELLAGTCDDPGPALSSLTPVAAGTSGAGSSQTTVASSTLEGHEHGALRLTASDGSSAACAPVHLSAGHRHGGG